MFSICNPKAFFLRLCIVFAIAFLCWDTMKPSPITPDVGPTPSPRKRATKQLDKVKGAPNMPAAIAAPPPRKRATQQLDKVKGVPSVANSSITPETRGQEEVRHVAFLKVHKTGSSTVQNIFIRFGESRKLTFILATKKHNECGGYSNCISFTKTLHDRNIVPPPRNKSYEILCSHVIYNKLSFRKYMPRDTRYIGLVREPATRLESAIAYFGLFKGVSKQQFAENPFKYQHTMVNNRMAFEFGFKAEWRPNSTHPSLSETDKVEVLEYLDELMDDFDLIMINERLDESLVLLRRLLGWTITDILYCRKMTGRHTSFRAEDIAKLKDYLHLDYLLYERAVEMHIARVANSGDDFMGEVNTFHRVNTEVNNYCNCPKCKVKPFQIAETAWYKAAEVTPQSCKNLHVNEVVYLKRIRGMQYRP